jgi:tetratricopeptide (TPR) repeat protein
MKVAALLAALLSALAAPVAAQAPRPNAGAAKPDAVAEAYAQYLLAHRLEDDEDIEGAIAAYKRAMTLDPKAADIGASLADLYMRQERTADAIATAEQALTIDPDNREAHRVLGSIYAGMASENARGARASQQTRQENLAKAIQHLERAAERPAGQGYADANLRAMLARLHMGAGSFDKAIPLLTELVKQEPGWQDGAMLLIQAYSSSGRNDEAVRWLEQNAQDYPQLLPTLADFYSRDGRWRDAASVYERALEMSPRSFDLRLRYASTLLNSDSDADIIKARDVLREAVSLQANNERALFLLAQAERRSGELDAAEATARRLIARNAQNPRGYFVLAEALEERSQYQAVVDLIEPVLPAFRAGAQREFALGMLLPHIGFAYQQLGQYDKAIEKFEEARQMAPEDLAIAGYLVQAHMSAKNYPAAAALARAARARRPDDVRMARLEAEALRQDGKAEQGIGLLEDLLKQQADEPAAYVALAQAYSNTSRGSEAIKLLQDAEAKFPNEDAITFELGAVFDKLKRYAEAEAAFRKLIDRDPEHAAALNYLGYMFAERGERLDESVTLLNRAIKLEPHNGSFLDSLGWAYYKMGKFDLAEQHLRRAAEQLPTNSVIQDHYGDVLARLGRHDAAIAAWNRALAGDGDSVNRGDIDQKIRAAREKLPRR